MEKKSHQPLLRAYPDVWMRTHVCLCALLTRDALVGRRRRQVWVAAAGTAVVAAVVA